jgi:predicted flavoprotein YhiN
MCKPASFYFLFWQLRRKTEKTEVSETHPSMTALKVYSKRLQRLSALSHKERQCAATYSEGTAFAAAFRREGMPCNRILR